MCSKEVSFNWDNHHGSLIKVFEKLLQNSSLVDCTLAAEGQYMKAHRVVLSACSSFFESLFSTESEKNPIVIFQDIRFEELKTIIEYMYHGNVKIPEDRIDHFIATAASLKIRGLGSEKTVAGKEVEEVLSQHTRQNSTPFTARKRRKRSSLSSSKENINNECNVDASNNEVIVPLSMETLPLPVQTIPLPVETLPFPVQTHLFPVQNHPLPVQMHILPTQKRPLHVQNIPLPSQNLPLPGQKHAPAQNHSLPVQNHPCPVQMHASPVQKPPLLVQNLPQLTQNVSLCDQKHPPPTQNHSLPVQNHPLPVQINTPPVQKRPLLVQNLPHPAQNFPLYDQKHPSPLQTPLLLDHEHPLPVETLPLPVEDWNLEHNQHQQNTSVRYGHTSGFGAALHDIASSTENASNIIRNNSSSSSPRGNSPNGGISTKSVKDDDELLPINQIFLPEVVFIDNTDSADCVKERSLLNNCQLPKV